MKRNASLSRKAAEFPRAWREAKIRRAMGKCHRHL